MEDGYDVLHGFVLRQPNRPSQIETASAGDCVQRLINKEVAAVITDVTALTWMASYLQLPGSYVSPVLQVNPFSFIYSNYSRGLEEYINPAVSAATLTDPNWLPFTEEIKSKYFGMQAPQTSTAVNAINMPSAIAAVVLLILPLVVGLMNGDLGPGIFNDARSGWRYSFRRLISQPTAKEAALFISDRENALQGNDKSFFRFAITQFEELRGEMATIKETYASAELLGQGGEEKRTTLMSKAPAMGSMAARDGDTAALLASMLAPVLLELREVKRQNAHLAEMLETLHKHNTSSAGGGSAAAPAVPCFGCGTRHVAPAGRPHVSLHQLHQQSSRLSEPAGREVV